MFRKRKDANDETMAMGRVVGVRNASPAHRVAQLHEREGEAAIAVQKSFRGMKGRQAKWYWEESAELRHKVTTFCLHRRVTASAPWRGHAHAIDATSSP